MAPGVAAAGKNPFPPPQAALRRKKISRGRSKHPGNSRKSHIPPLSPRVGIRSSRIFAAHPTSDFQRRDGFLNPAILIPGAAAANHKNGFLDLPRRHEIFDFMRRRAISEPEKKQDFKEYLIEFIYYFF
jgi:hypothetical protein